MTIDMRTLSTKVSTETADQILGYAVNVSDALTDIVVGVSDLSEALDEFDVLLDESCHPFPADAAEAFQGHSAGVRASLDAVRLELRGLASAVSDMKEAATALRRPQQEGADDE